MWQCFLKCYMIVIYYSKVVTFLSSTSLYMCLIKMLQVYYSKMQSKDKTEKNVVIIFNI